MRKREGITVLKRISVVLCGFKQRFGSDLLLQKIVFVIPLIITQRKPLIICRQTDRQMDIVNSEFYFRYNFANQLRTALDT